MMFLYKLYLLGENTTLYSSVYDSLGMENFSGIDKYFKYKNELNSTIQKPIIPRKDQEEVLNYKGGLMSVSATAGSGKTTIMLLLVDKILSGEILDNIEPKNILKLVWKHQRSWIAKEILRKKNGAANQAHQLQTVL